MAKPNPQFNTPLSPSQINAELPFYPLYGVTPDNKYTPISITENGELSIGSVTITGPVTVSDVVIKGVDPDNSFTTEDMAVFNLGPSNGYAMRSTLFDGGNHLAINPDGSINVGFSGATVVTAKIEDTAGNALTSIAGSLHVNVTNTVPVSQSGSWTVSLASGSIEIGTVDQGTPNTLANAWPVKPTDGTNSQSFTASGEAKISITQPLPAGTNALGSVSVSNFPATQPISAVSLPLPTGASTSANQTNGSQKTQIVDGSGNVIASTSNALNVDVTNTVAISGTVTANAGTGTFLVDGSAHTQPVSGTVTANQGGAPWSVSGSGNFTVVQPTGTNLHTVVDSGSITVANATLAVTQSGAWTTGRTWTLASGTDSVSAVQSGNWSTRTQDGAGNAITSTGNALDVNLKTSSITLSISGTVTANIGTTNGLALDATVSGLQVSQGSTTSGQKGTLIQGAVTTAAPTYTTAQTSPLSLTPAGALRVDGSAVTQPVSGTVAATQSGSWTVSLTTESIEIGTVDQGTAGTLANGWPVKLSDGTNLIGVTAHPVRTDPTGTTTQPISGSVSVSNFPATQAVTQSTSPWVVSLASTTITGTVAVTQSTSPWVVSGTITANAGTGNFNENLAQVNGSTVVTAATGIQKVGISDSAGSSITNGQKTSANSVPVVVASDQSAIPVNVAGGSVSSATVTSNSVGSGAAVTLLASRAARIRAVIFNEAGTLFVKAGSTASSSDYTWRLTANTELDVTDYTGILTAIKSAGTTNVQATDF